MVPGLGVERRHHRVALLHRVAVKRNDGVAELVRAVFVPVERLNLEVGLEGVRVLIVDEYQVALVHRGRRHLLVLIVRLRRRCRFGHGFGRFGDRLGRRDGRGIAGAFGRAPAADCSGRASHHEYHESDDEHHEYYDGQYDERPRPLRLFSRSVPHRRVGIVGLVHPAVLILRRILLTCRGADRSVSAPPGVDLPGADRSVCSARSGCSGCCSSSLLLCIPAGYTKAGRKLTAPRFIILSYLS